MQLADTENRFDLCCRPLALRPSKFVNLPHACPAGLMRGPVGRAWLERANDPPYDVGTVRVDIHVNSVKACEESGLYQGVAT